MQMKFSLRQAQLAEIPHNSLVKIRAAWSYRRRQSIQAASQNISWSLDQFAQLELGRAQNLISRQGVPHLPRALLLLKSYKNTAYLN
jgi:hypothetical protein